jgi:Ribosomal protein L7/L12 C-terminal domain
MGLFNRAPKVVVPVRQLTAAECEQVRALTADGKLIQAVKVVRELTGMGLKDAKDTAEAIRDGRYLVAGAAGAAPGVADLADRVRALKAEGQWHAASALVCAETGMAKSEADRFVAALET